ncbi:uncharacterized protein LOC135485339 isoform X1 [Lineus longissimus]|uniref:uncharacterized protein LOC135485339 isoform X1 n=1 Tax=Lineus longissimus TaxID=88925 RepID=UPI002B4F0137
MSKKASASHSVPKAGRGGVSPLRTKKQQEEMLLENKILTEKVEVLTKQTDDMKNKLELIMTKIVDYSNKEDYEITEDTYILDIETSDILEMISKIVSGDHGKDTLETRVEELETRVTHQNCQVARLTQHIFMLEDGLRSIRQCRDLASVFTLTDSIEDKIVTFQDSDAGMLMTNKKSQGKRLPQIGTGKKTPQDDRKESQIRATEIKIEQESVSGTSDGSLSFPSLPDTVIKYRNNIIQQKIKTLHQNSMELGATLNKMLPQRKLPPNTHISKMNPFLKQYLSNELSLEKASGADWRMLARKVGIIEEQIVEWRKKKVDAPLFEVFKVWERSVAATVQILHRHLISPTLRCSILAKRIRDFYDVD